MNAVLSSFIELGGMVVGVVEGEEGREGRV